MSIARKIAAIIAKARGNSNEHEALAFMAKAEQMMRKHNIRMEDLDSFDDPLGLDPNLIKISSLSWQMLLLTQIAGYYNCAAIRIRNPGVRGAGSYMLLSGKESATTTVRLMWPFVLKSLYKEVSNVRELEGGARSRSKVARSIAFMLAVRVANLRAKRDGVTASEMYKRSKEFLEQEIPDLGTARIDTRNVDPADQKYAEKVSLNLQTGGQTQSPTLSLGKE